MPRRKRKSNPKGLKILNTLLISLLVIYLAFLYYNDALNLNTNSFNEFIDSIKDIGNSNKVPNNIQTNTIGNLYVYYVDVGQADSIMLTNNNEYMLIDAGNNEDGKLLVDYFKSLNISKFNYVFGTHAHEDHIGGMDTIIDNFDIDNFYMPDVITTTKTYEDVLDSLNNKDIKYRIPRVSDTYSLGSAVVTVLYVGNNNKDLNDTSIILRVNYGSNCFLFTGDASKNVEKQLLDQDLKCDVLKIGHHGSQYSSSSDFIKKVSPSYGIISVGENNKYNHPTKNTLDILENNNVTIYRTDEKGTVIARSDGNEITFEFTSTNTDGN